MWSKKACQIHPTIHSTFIYPKEGKKTNKTWTKSLQQTIYSINSPFIFKACQNVCVVRLPALLAELGFCLWFTWVGRPSCDAWIPSQVGPLTFPSNDRAGQCFKWLLEIWMPLSQHTSHTDAHIKFVCVWFTYSEQAYMHALKLLWESRRMEAR